MDIRQAAKTSGYSLIFMAVLAGFAFAYALPLFIQSTVEELSTSFIGDNLTMYLWMLISIYAILILDLIVSWSLYCFFKQEDKKLALLGLLSRVSYTIVLGYASLFLSDNLYEINPVNALFNFKEFQHTWSIGLLLFGFHLIVLALLMKKHPIIPQLLWYITGIAGLAYLFINGLKIEGSIFERNIRIIEYILGLPLVLGELGIAFWMVFQGGKGSKNKY